MRPPPHASSISSNPDAHPPMPPLPPGYSVSQPPLEPLRPLRSSSLKSLNPLSRSRSERRKDRNKEDKRVGASSSMGNLLQMQDALVDDDTPMTTSTPLPALSLLTSKSPPLLLTPIPASPSPSSINEVPPTPPPKSPGSRYFSSLRRLASTSRPLPGVGRTSVSSSDDSMGVATPPDLYDGGSVSSNVGHSAAVNGHPVSSQTNTSPHGSPHIGGIAWPALGTKKSVGSLGKSAANLAGKMWNRSRSKSNTSTVSSLSEGPSSPPPPMPVPVPALPPPSVLNIDTSSSSVTPFVIPPIETNSYEDDPMADSSTSSTPTADPRLLPTTMPGAPVRTKSHPAPHARPPALVLTTSNSAPSSLLPVPKTAPETRPTSWTSVSSSGSSVAQSPLFDKAIFDAFPSVPVMTPQQTTPVQHRPLPTPNRTNSLNRGGVSSPGGSVRPLPSSPPGYSILDTSSIQSTPTSERGNTSFEREGLRLAETQRRVNPLP
ncbi:hypothetical protein B0H14DRAFT_1147891 [Mycena olivaceomarginata]|nr:hypothetical protein B0H14DRAFT_1147891 [Mycena olivaceomarginata]